MAKKTQDKERTEDEPTDEEPGMSDEGSDAETEETEQGSSDSAEADLAAATGEGDELADGEEGDDEEEEVQAAGTLGIERHVMAGFFAAGLLGAYVLGKTIHGIWASLSGRDWFSSALPMLAAIEDDSKTTYGTLLGAAIALFLTVRYYRRPDVRQWTDDVASELAKVKWPNRKDVYSSTVVVIAASTVFTAYLAILDRLWSFITNLVYGTGV